MINALLVFVSCFFVVFALGFQSLNVNQGKYAMAFLTSFLISVGNWALLKIVPQPDANILVFVAYMTGGPLGIICAMWVHRKLFGKKKRSYKRREKVKEEVPLGI
jgi:hypothetical protein